MEIDVASLSNEQLVALNRYIVEELRRRQRNRTEENMSKFNLGDKVFFVTPDGERKTGTILRLNQKTASLIADDGCKWRVSPQMLRMMQTQGEKSNLQVVR